MPHGPRFTLGIHLIEGSLAQAKEPGYRGDRLHGLEKFDLFIHGSNSLKGRQ